MVISRRRQVAGLVAALSALAGTAGYVSITGDSGAGEPRSLAASPSHAAASPTPSGKAGGTAGSKSPATPQPAPTASGKPAATRLSKPEAGTRLRELAEAYNAGTLKLQQAATGNPADLTAVRAAVPAAVAAYRRWLDGLRVTRWPTDAQPAVDTYLRRSPAGLKALTDLQTAKTTGELRTPKDPSGLRALKDAEDEMRTKLLG
jgi:hypothetical protein